MPRPIHREHIRQKHAAMFVREAIAAPHLFLAFDRSAAGGQFSHMREKARGIKAGTPDTVLMVLGMPPLWAEWKADGNKPTDDQTRMGDELNAIGHRWGWFTSVVAYHEWLATAGVPMHPNAAFLALHHDAAADTVIARAERKKGTAPKSYRPQAPKPSRRRLDQLAAVRGRVPF